MDAIKTRMSLFRMKSEKLQQLEYDRIEQDRRFAASELRKQELEAELRRHERAEFARNEQARREKEAHQLQVQKAEMVRQQRQMQQQAEERQRQERQRQERLRQSTPEGLRHLRTLIRQRYERDINIWASRGVLRADRDLVVRDGHKADLVLAEIRQIVGSWNEADGWATDEWRVVKKIKEGLANSDQRMWEKQPPWI